jgi:mannan endo-1,6-alpha-mannosidase
MRFTSLVAFLALLAPLAHALDIDFTSKSSINAGLALIAKGLMDYYNGNQTGQTPGMFSNPYYWWEAGAAWNSMLDYWYYTGDDTYNDLLKSSLLFQVGDNWNYMPSNQTTTEGNDDQAFWGITVMAAAEKNFSNPLPHEPQWLYLAQAVFNTMAARWDNEHCEGGLRWQIFKWNNGYNYKNTISNGCLFMLGARLARFTRNNTYAEWAEKTWDWVVEKQFVNNQTDAWPVYDGGNIEEDCNDIVGLEWTYNSGLFMAGSAYMYNYTNDTKWLTRIQHIWARSKIFYDSDTKIMYEAACQPTGQCNNDQRSFKGIYSRFLGLTCLMAPEMNAEIQEYLAATTVGVLRSCSGGTDGHTCGLNWQESGWDGKYGLGEQMSALEALQNRLIWTKPPPLSQDTGASSTGNGSAGGNTANELVRNELDIQTKDRAGAGIITTLLVILFLSTAWWMIV